MWYGAFNLCWEERRLLFKLVLRKLIKLNIYKEIIVCYKLIRNQVCTLLDVHIIYLQRKITTSKTPIDIQDFIIRV